jgi:hypothetical protein
MYYVHCAAAKREQKANVGTAMANEEENENGLPRVTIVENPIVPGEAYYVDEADAPKTTTNNSTVLNRLKALFWPTSSTTGKPRKPASGKTDAPASLEDTAFFNWYRQKTNTPVDRRGLYNMYDLLDELPEVYAVLDAMAEDSTQTDRERQVTVWVDSNSAKVKEISLDLFGRIELEDTIFGMARDTAKYGDDFAELITDKSIGIDGLKWYDPREVERVESKDGYLLGFLHQNMDLMSGVTYGEVKDKVKWKPWQMIHWRMRKRKLPKVNPNAMYGAWSSVLYPARRAAQQLLMLEDMLSIYRLTRTMDRYIFYVDTGTVSAQDDIKTILKEWKRAFKRKVFYDRNQGLLHSQNDPLSFIEDIFWPTRPGSESKVEVLEGNPNVADIEDVNHFINKMFGSLGAPKAYFGYEGDVDTRATLSMQDVRFSRKVKPIQRALIVGLSRMLDIELALKGQDPKKADYTMRMVAPSILEDLNRLDAIQSFTDIAERMYELGQTMNLNMDEWRKYCLGNILGFTDLEVKKYTTFPPGEEPPPEGEEEGGGGFGRRETAADKETQELIEQIDQTAARVLNGRGITISVPAHIGRAKHPHSRSVARKVLEDHVEVRTAIGPPDEKGTDDGDSTK